MQYINVNIKYIDTNLNIHQNNYEIFIFRIFKYIWSYNAKYKFEYVIIPQIWIHWFISEYKCKSEYVVITLNIKCTFWIYWYNCEYVNVNLNI